MANWLTNCSPQFSLLFVFLLGLLAGPLIYGTFSFNKNCMLINAPVFKPLTQVMNRNDIAKLLISEGFTSGAEIGVQLGIYSEILLNNWANCTEYHAIDLWAQQANYADGANIDNGQQETRYQVTKNRLKRFEHFVRYHRNYSHLVVNEIKDNSLDFIYVDARHDYTGVMQDMVLYWPKLKVGGIFAGHDYLDTSETKGLLNPANDWAIDYRGVKRTDNKAVKSAVNEFAANHQRQILVTYPEPFPSWYMRK